MIKIIIRSHGRDLYIPNSFPDKSSDKQLKAVCRDYLNTEFPDWDDAALDIMRYKRGINIKNKRLFIKK